MITLLSTSRTTRVVGTGQPLKTNTFAIVGFIAAFMLPVVGIVFGARG